MTPLNADISDHLTQPALKLLNHRSYQFKPVVGCHAGSRVVHVELWSQPLPRRLFALDREDTAYNNSRRVAYLVDFSGQSIAFPS